MVEIPIWVIQIFVGLFLVQFMGAIIWAATMTERVATMMKKIESLSGFAMKQDVDREIGRLESNINKAHDRIDEIKLKVA